MAGCFQGAITHSLSQLSSRISSSMSGVVINPSRMSTLGLGLDLAGSDSVANHLDAEAVAGGKPHIGLPELLSLQLCLAPAKI
eukprot:1041727-Rhodomonas_salina.1